MRVVKQNPAAAVVVIKGYADPTKSVFHGTTAWIVTISGFLTIALVAITKMA